jgi:hypothetical protein
VRRPFVVGSAALALLVLTTVVHADDFVAWILTQGRIRDAQHFGNEPVPVGSLQKPFLVRAWAADHATGATPMFHCSPSSGCWRPSGHGTLDLRGALRDSCNTYFRFLARGTSARAIEASFRDTGFLWDGTMTEAEAIGIHGSARSRITPSRLLEGYVSLTGVPWPSRDDVRKELLDGLKDAADSGTAAGLRLWGFRAKTGTVPALDGTPLKTSGFAMILDDTGFALLGLLRKGTGREAAIRAGDMLSKLRPDLLRRPAAGDSASGTGTAPRPTTSPVRRLEDDVRVEMLNELRLEEVRLVNAGSSPTDSTRGFIGPGAEVTVAAEERFSAGLWQIRASRPAFKRTVKAALEVTAVQGSTRLIATMTSRDYINGVLRAELGLPSSNLRTPLAAATLRYLAHGPRHARADVCDSTHCTWFVGEGPVPRWISPAVSTTERGLAAALTDDEWNQAKLLARDRADGPDLWTADCGGDPVSPHFLWGNGDRRLVSCPRHGHGSGRIWRRVWPEGDLVRIFGVRPRSIEVAIVNGQWFLKVMVAGPSVETRRNALLLNYDDAHRRLAGRLGWDALPSPAARVLPTARGFVAEGVGLGHRAGLCLAP